MDIIKKIAADLSVTSKQVAVAIKLLDEGATVPFIARYRKEMTENLTDTDLRTIQTQLIYLRELVERQEVILKSIEEQGKLTPQLAQTIKATDNKARLEDLYLPYKPKRRTKAQLAKEAGLEPLALQIWHQPDLEIADYAQQFLTDQVVDVASALEGARQILMELWSEDAEVTRLLREFIWENAILVSTVIIGQEELGKKFADYFDYKEALKKIPSHRALALFRGRREKILKIALELPETQKNYPEEVICQFFHIPKQHNWLVTTAQWAWQIKLLLRLELDVMNRLREIAETQAIQVFASNLKDLLLAAPAGAKVTMGLDPGFRTGVKIAIIDNTAKLLNYTTIFPHPPHNQWQKSLTTLTELCQEYAVELISIGNGTASRETDKLVTELLKNHVNHAITKIVVSEAGASVYSASKIAAEEFPDLDVSYRGAVSIARRLQDPLAELVKIAPQSIGVGQYQHDVSQLQLAKNLAIVIEDCVNAVGVDVNTASVPLLARVSGLNETIATNIVEFRNNHGAFSARAELKKIPRLGTKTFEQAAGFLRILNGTNPLDSSAVHPEAYPVVKKILNQHNISIKAIMGNTELLHSLQPQKFVDEQFGLPTVQDILKELEKPGRDPRPEFKTANFKEGIEHLADLQAGMVLEGTITNVTHFGAFVDIGVHQEGLVHKSQMANRFINDPREIVKVGEIVTVTVIAVDLPRKRINLSMCEAKDLPTIIKKRSTSANIKEANSLLATALNQALKDKKLK